MRPGVTVAITAVGNPRRAWLSRALESVWAQTYQPQAVVISQDTGRLGAAHNRQYATDSVETEYVAYLDDDDEFHPWHLAELLKVAEDTGADLVYPWFDVRGGSDPFAFLEGKPWENTDPHIIPVTFLARIDKIDEVGGWLGPRTDPDYLRMPDGQAGEDWQLTLRLIAADAKIVHHPRRTWVWNHTGQNSSGLPSRINWG